MALNQKSIYNLNFKLLDFGGAVKRVFNFILHHDTYTCIKRNKDLANRSNGKMAYILALGPSLKMVDLSKIDGDTMVVNRFYRMGSLFPDFVPTYYIMIDYKFGEEENKNDLRAALDMYYDKGTVFLLNPKLKSSGFLANYPEDRIYYLSCFGGDIHSDKKYRLDGILPAFQNVVGSSIMALSLMGYKRITLLGCDFNSFASPERIHCYKDESTVRPDRMSWELFAYSIVAHQYDVLQEYAQRNFFEIINSTKGSLIDAFPLEIDESVYFNELDS